MSQVDAHISRVPVRPEALQSAPRSLPSALTEHVARRLGHWPPRRPFEAIVWSGRDHSGWDGGHWPLLGLVTPFGTVLSISPHVIEGKGLGRLDQNDLDAALRGTHPFALGKSLGQPNLRRGLATFRWSTTPTPGPDVGSWLTSTDQRLPDWLRPFGGESLVCWGGRTQASRPLRLGALGCRRADPPGKRVGSRTGHPGRPARPVRRRCSRLPA